MLLLPVKQQLFNRTGGGVVHMAQVAIVPLINLVIPTVLSTYGRYGPGIEINGNATGLLAADTWTTANQAQLYEITIPVTFTVRAIRWRSGTSVAGNYDVGIYDGNFSLLRSTGSKPHPGANTPVEEVISPLRLQPGNYWLAFVSDNVGFGILARNSFAASALSAIPIRGASLAFPLPATLTPTSPPQTEMQLIALANAVL